ncbi:DEAD/DEAH box helicase [Methanoplanus endosymbiosus]|uniref:DEAD/DEAH box helicase n=1 Tax=Methanoplanus endosymbiosus TaxID=33865 RepID=A0A9E7PME8_9EURY|nr:DEAD/DEAH box helicase [Methanoplanus endosymbiosus]UUX92868.1 DEAD/DEAH box helicase [Methanoplanus endosymbiosus]
MRIITDNFKDINLEFNFKRRTGNPVILFYINNIEYMIVPAFAEDLLSGKTERADVWKGSKKPGYLSITGDKSGSGKRELEIHIKDVIYRVPLENFSSVIENESKIHGKIDLEEVIKKNKEQTLIIEKENKVRKLKENARKSEGKIKNSRRYEVIDFSGDIPGLIKSLKANSMFKAGIVEEKIIEEKPAVFENPHHCVYKIYEFLRNEGIQLYSHQTETIEHAINGRNVIITTPTASGKSLAFMVPIINSIINNPKSRALLIYPTKALISDQLKSIREMVGKIDPAIKVEKYDGDTKPDERKRIRQNKPSILITNPDMLHIGILHNHKQWSFLFSNLSYVVMDEAHTYRGVFGSHIALLTRRLKLIAGRYNSDPNFILSSATIANPVEHAENLTGEKFVLVDKNGSKTNEKTFIFYQADKPSQVKQTAELLAYLSSSGIQTLCFAKTRRSTELIADAAKKIVREESTYNSTKPCKIVSYRSGYRSGERAEIEAGIKSGKTMGISSTNALELGIDIGSLDCVIISGYPGSIMSTWQQAGRAGRKYSSSLVIFMGFNNPLEKFIINNPDEFFNKPSEHATIDTSNKYILTDHLICALMENGELSAEHNSIFNCDIDEKLEKAAASAFYKHLIKKDKNKWYPVEKKHIQGDVQIRNGTSGETFKVISRNKVIETLSKEQVYREGHEGAIILHGDGRYRVSKLDLKTHSVYVTEENTENHTIAESDITVKTGRILNKIPVGKLEINFSQMIVQERYTKYSEHDYKGKISEYCLNLPPVSIETKGLWFTIPKEAIDKSGPDLKTSEILKGLKGVENILSVVIPHFVLCDHNDIRCAVYDKYGPKNEATVIIFDNYMGGVGLSEKAQKELYNILKMALNIVQSCKCKNGCISCIYSYNDAEERRPDKEMTITILKDLLQQFKCQE